MRRGRSPAGPRRHPASPRLLRAALLAALGVAILLAGASVTAPAARAASDAVVAMQVVNVDPIVPKATNVRSPLELTLRLTNQSGSNLSDVDISVERGDPIGRPDVLEKFLAAPAPATDALSIPTTHAVRTTLPAHKTTEVVVPITTSRLNDGKGLCICDNQIYPLFLSAHITGSGGDDRRVGDTAVVLPGLLSDPSPVHVGWVWSLLERPHRLTGTTAFEDDDLASSVSRLGRLDRALAVLEELPAGLPVTVVADPETLDELAVMRTGRYTIGSGARARPGTGADAAGDWLRRLAAVLADPARHLEVTPYADPNVQALDSHGLTWQSALPTAMAARIRTALPGVTLDADTAWPAAGRIGTDTLARLVGDGASTVVLDSAAVRTSDDAQGTDAATGFARLAVPTAGSSGGTTAVKAALLDPALQKLVATAVAGDSTRATALPTLASQLAVRAISADGAAQSIIMASPRYVDPVVAAAVLAITSTSTSRFSRPISLSAAVSGAASGSPVRARRSSLSPPSTDPLPLPEGTVTSVRLVSGGSSTIRSLVGTRTASGAALLTSLPIARQRIESSAWSSSPQNLSLGARYAARLSSFTGSIPSSVRIVPPSTGSYTLASSTSDLPITVSNDLAYRVSIRVRVAAAGGLPGFAAQDETQTIAPRSKATLRIQTTVQRSGRFRVAAILSAPDGSELGPPVDLSVRSSALGVIGLVVTIVAGGLLVLALLVRSLRAFLRRRQTTRPLAATDRP